jgi:hypothetical protein
MLNRLAAWIDRALIKAQIAKIVADIDFEVRYHARHDERMTAWLAEIARLRAQERARLPQRTLLQSWLSMSPTRSRDTPAVQRFISQRTHANPPRVVAGTSVTRRQA